MKRTRRLKMKQRARWRVTQSTHSSDKQWKDEWGTEGTKIEAEREEQQRVTRRTYAEKCRASSWVECERRSALTIVMAVALWIALGICLLFIFAPLVSHRRLLKQYFGAADIHQTQAHQWQWVCHRLCRSCSVYFPHQWHHHEGHALP